MLLHVYPCPMPQESALQASLDGAVYHDCYAVELAQAAPHVLSHFLCALARAPRWTNLLMGLRNAMVRPFGFKDPGLLNRIDRHKPAAAYLPGEAIGIFTLYRQTPDLALLGLTDRHLRVQLSVCRSTASTTLPARLYISTVVHARSLTGRLYLLPVLPLHRLIAPAIARRAQGHIRPD